MDRIWTSNVIVGGASVCWYRLITMNLIPVVVISIISLGLSMIHGCLSMVIPSSNTTNDILSNMKITKFSSTNKTTTSHPTHILRIRIRVHNSLIETLVNQNQLDLIEIQLRQRHIPYHRIQDNKDGITIMIGPFHKPINFTAIQTIFNQTRFQTNVTKLISIKKDSKNQTNVIIHSDKKKIQVEHIPMTVEAHEYNLVYDQESYEFRNCLEACEIYEDNELKPDHNCIRQKCLKEITGI